MKKSGFLYICCAFSLCTNAFAGELLCSNFTIRSDLDPRYVKFIKKNAEAYYNNLQGRYFHESWRKPLTIYYSKTQSDTQQLLDRNGHNHKINYGFYDSDEPAVYTHRLMNDGGQSGWGTLFHEITHHFVHLNFKNPPAWFDEGLACFLGEQTEIVNGKLTVGRPSPQREQILRGEIEQGHRLNVKRLLSSSEGQFSDWDLGCHFARAFFYWLHETGQLKEYLKTVKTKGYDLSVLEETLSLSYGEINVELLKFIRKDCYAGAYLMDGMQAEDEALKIGAFEKALELKPDYRVARLKLAECQYANGGYENCRENLTEILYDPECIEYRRAACVTANIYYKQKDYPKAIEYYEKAWEYSDYYEYKYRLAYKIGNCFYNMKNREDAICWYEKFLDCKWEQESMKAGEDFVRKYIERVNAAANEKLHKRENKTKTTVTDKQ